MEGRKSTLTGCSRYQMGFTNTLLYGEATPEDNQEITREEVKGDVQKLKMRRHLR